MMSGATLGDATLGTKPLGGDKTPAEGKSI